MGSLINNHITDHCNSNIFKHRKKYWFQNNHSTSTISQELLNNITKIIDDGNWIDVITVDFAKTFDLTSH